VFLPHVEKGFLPKFHLDWHQYKNLIPYSIGNYISNVLSQLTLNLLPIIYLEILGPEKSGHAYIALMLGMLTLSPGISLASSTFAEAANDESASFTIIIKGIKVGLLITSITAVFLFATGPWMLSVFFGKEFSTDGSSLLRWLTVSSITIVFNQFYFTWLRLKKQIKRLITLSSIIAGINLLVTYFLINTKGMVAGGIAMFVSHIVFSIYIILNYNYQRKSKPMMF
jgi:O-antigen/teichoic acid export membrane protein